MDLYEEILALLTAKFQGVRKDGLQQLAAGLGLQATNKEEATALVDKLTAEQVDKFVKDWRKAADAEIKKANETHEAGLRKKYDFKEKEATTTTTTTTTETGNDQPLTLDAIRELIREETKGVRDSITNLNADKVAATRREQFVKALSDAKVEGRQRDMMLRNFDRVNSFADDDAFNAYMTEAQGDITALAQERANSGLQGHEKPIFGAVNDKGVSSGVADYIKAQTEPTPALTGKQL